MSESARLIADDFLDELARRAQASPRLRMHCDMRTSEKDTSQRMLNALEKGTVVPVHRHLETSETQLLLRGVIDVTFWNDEGREIERHRIDPKKGVYGIDIPAGTWHSLEVIEPGVLFEAKDGAFQPADPGDVKDVCA